jgi:glycosyltransferase involved in cell wall biosynthesis
MRIGIDARFWHSKHAGISQYTKGLVKSLAAIDRQHDYYVIIRKEDLSEWDVGAPNFHPVVIDIPHYSLAEQLFLPWKLLSLHLDLVHFCNFNHPILYPGRFTVTIHDLAYYFFPGRRLRGFLFQWGYYLVMWLAVRRAARVVAVTDYVKKEIVRRFGLRPWRVVVIHEGVDPARLKHRRIPASAVAALKRRLGIVSPVILYIANWRPHKNHRTLLEAFALVRQKKVKAQLVLGGTPSAELLDVIDRHPFKKDIVVAGFIPEGELPLYYALATVYVFPSLYEGFGLPLLEAQYLGVPVATSQATSLPEIGGESVRYFAPLDAGEMALVVSSILRDRSLQKELVQKGYANVRRFSWEETARATFNLFQRVITS